MAEKRKRIFDTRSYSWIDSGLNQLDRRVIRRARVSAVLLLLAIVAILVINDHRKTLFGLDTPVKIATVIALLILGWFTASALGRAVGPAALSRMDPATAGAVGFVARLLVMAIVLLVAAFAAGIGPVPLTIAVSFSAVVFGLAAQQTLGNVIAGLVLFSARPFRVGDRVRLQAGGVGGQIEGVVSSLGLLYTSFATGEDLTMVPNSVVLNCAVMPLREPDAVDLRARLRSGLSPHQLQRLLERDLKTPVRRPPRITLEELDGDEVVVRITAIPKLAADGPALASEVLDIVSPESRDVGQELADVEEGGAEGLQDA